MSTFFKNELIIDPYAISNAYAHMYGSRRLGLFTGTSDYDFYFHISDLDKLGTSFFELKSKNIIVKEQSFNDYITSKPKYGKAFLLKALPILDNTHADILIFSDKRDVAIMDKVLTILSESVTNTALSDKELRIAVYNQMLQEEGFIPNINNDFTFPIKTKKIAELVKAGYIPKEEKATLRHDIGYNAIPIPDELTTKKEKQSWLKSTYTKLTNTCLRR